MTEATLHACMHWRRKWQPAPVFLPEESQGRRSLVGCLQGVTWSWTRLKCLSRAAALVICFIYSAVSSLHVNLQVVYIQRWELCSHVQSHAGSRVWCTVLCAWLCLCALYCTVYSTIVRYLCSKPRAFGSKCKSRSDVVYFSRYSTVRLEMFFCCVCFYVLFVWEVL